MIDYVTKDIPEFNHFKIQNLEVFWHTYLFILLQRTPTPLNVVIYRWVQGEKSPFKSHLF